ncbi:hypothetical protein HK101_006594 [Irineochytrium annulatum]|nr:hypothetical protein HK101_006594 [Irineochytrium annulatum]
MHRYVKDHHVAHGEGCPLASGKCPYYDQHKGDKNVADLLMDDAHKCPLSGKCTFYDDLKAGKSVDLDGHNCPIADKCPYYSEIKSHKAQATECPLEKACPHFKKGSNPHAEMEGKSSEECPHLKKVKAEEAKAAKIDHSEL